MKRDELFRQWYDERTGTKSESFAYDVWCAAWEAALKNSERLNYWRSGTPDYEQGFIDGMSHQIKADVDRRMSSDLLQEENEGNRFKETQLRSFRLR